jgi:hypothetical protein
MNSNSSRAASSGEFELKRGVLNKEHKVSSVVSQKIPSIILEGSMPPLNLAAGHYYLSYFWDTTLAL